MKLLFLLAVLTLKLATAAQITATALQIFCKGSQNCCGHTAPITCAQQLEITSTGRVVGRAVKYVLATTNQLVSYTYGAVRISWEFQFLSADA